ncbi:MAG TPA: hypothetical protein VFC65_15890 [Prolixibacteraceae bacterium]|nr:hypothetical protein [Prolixibacteraceae bacterium]
MKRAKLLVLLMFFFGISSFAQKMIGYGGELSVLSIKPNVRKWFSKTTGVEVFGGIASELEDFNPDDLEAGFKFLHALIYTRTDRTYIGFVGKWKWVNGVNPGYHFNLPVAGVLIGKEWFLKRIHRKSFAVELGYQYGVKEYGSFSNNLSVSERFEEFPLILNIRYSFYKKK